MLNSEKTDEINEINSWDVFFFWPHVENFDILSEISLVS